jgi:hypothetical protein
VPSAVGVGARVADPSSVCSARSAQLVRFASGLQQRSHTVWAAVEEVGHAAGERMGSWVGLSVPASVCQSWLPPQRTLSSKITHLLSLSISAWHSAICDRVVSSSCRRLLGLVPLLGRDGSGGWRRPLILCLWDGGLISLGSCPVLAY